MDPKSPRHPQVEPVNMLGDTILNLPLIYRRHQSFVKERYGITLQELEIIQDLCLNGQRRMKDVGEQFQIKLSTLTSLVDKLERRRLVRRVPSPDDRRVIMLEKTDASKEICQAYLNRLQAFTNLLSKRYDHVKVDAIANGIGLIRSMI